MMIHTLISLIAKEVGINEEGRKIQKETDTYIHRTIVKQGGWKKIQKTISESPRSLER